MNNLLSTCKNIIIFSLLAFFISACAKIDPTTGEKILIEPNPQKKAKDFADKGGGIFGDINNKKTSGTNFEFASSNILWRSTLKSLDFLPLVNADYSGGVIIYDWYSDQEKDLEQIKVSIKFLSNELRSDSLQITVHKKTCEENTNKCKTVKLSNKLPEEIKEKILLTARALRIEEEKNKKN
jgi:hypothetical protein